MRWSILPGLAALILAAGCVTLPRVPEANSEVADDTRTLVRISGVRPGGGTVMCAVFADRQSYEGDGRPHRAAALPANRESVEWMIELPRGSYAFKAYQDLDGDAELDRNGLGSPVEPYGFSSAARVRYGPPSWSAARIQLDGPSQVIEISLL